MESQEFLNEFVEEVTEHLQELESSILVLEREGSRPEQISQIFRAAHSIKGASAYMGFEQLANLTHELESRFSEIQARSGHVPHEGISLLLECVDFISEALKQIQQEGEEPSVSSSFLARLREVFAGSGSPQEKPSDEVEAVLEEECEEAPASEPSDEEFEEDVLSVFENPGPEESGEAREAQEKAVAEEKAGERVDEETAEDEDHELLAIFLEALSENLAALARLVPTSTEGWLSRDGLEAVSRILDRAIASSQYMDLTQCMEVLRQWREELNEAHEREGVDREAFVVSIDEHFQKLRELLPALEPPLIPAPSEEVREGGTRFREEDEEILAIFLDAVSEHLTGLTRLAPAGKEATLSEEAFGRVRELLDRMIASCNYMDYRTLADIFYDWREELSGFHERDEDDRERFADLFGRHAAELERILPDYRAPLMPRAVEQTREGEEELEEEDEELVSIFVNALQERLAHLARLTPPAPEAFLSEADCEQVFGLIRHMASSALYMDYEDCVAVLDEWQEALLEKCRSGGLDGGGFLDLYHSHTYRLHEQLPDLEIPEPSRPEEAAEEETEAAIEEEDEEILGIFLESLQENLSLYAALVRSSGEFLSDEDFRSVQEALERMSTSAQYMDYEHMAEILGDWRGELSGLYQEGLAKPEGLTELYNRFVPRIGQMLPRLQAPRLGKEEKPEEGLEEEDEEILGIFLDSFQENLDEVAQLAPPGQEELTEKGAEKALEMIDRLVTSCEYMDYEKMLGILRGWREEIQRRLQTGRMEGVEFRELYEHYTSLLEGALPRLQVPELPSAVGPQQEESEVIEEEDEELLGIFLESFQENLSLMADLIPAAAGSPLSGSDVQTAGDCLKRMSTSAQYMNYDYILETLAEWENKLMDEAREGGLLAEDYAGLVKEYSQRLQRIMPRLELPELKTPAEAPEEKGEAVELEEEIDHLFDDLESQGPLADFVEEEGAEPGAEMGTEIEESLADVEKTVEEEIAPELAAGFPEGPVEEEPLEALQGPFPREAEGEQAEEEEAAGGPEPAEAHAEEKPSETLGEQLEKETKARRKGAGAEEVLSSTSLRVDATKVDQLLNQVGELVVTRSEFVQASESFREILRTLYGQGKLSKQEMRDLRSFSFRLNESTVSLGRVTTDLQDSVMRIRMLPISYLFQRFPRVVRDQALKLGKKVELFVRGGDTEMDKRVLEQMYDPLVQFLRNAIAHGIEPPEERKRKNKPETGKILLSAYHEGNHVVLEIEDDGSGVDAAKLKQILVERRMMSVHEVERLSNEELAYSIFLPGVSTREEVDGSAGRGVGLDVVKENVERMNGTVEVESTLNKFTRFTIRIPLTVAIIQALLVEEAKQVFTLPLTSVSEILRYTPDDVHTIEGFSVIKLRGKTVPVMQLAQLLNLRAVESGNGNEERKFIVIVVTSFREVGLIVDDLVGEREVVIKSLEDEIYPFEGFSGATILGDGTVSLILDVSTLLKSTKSLADEYIAAPESTLH